MAKKRRGAAEDRRCLSTDRFSSDQDRDYVSSELFSLEEARLQRSTVLFRRTTVRRQRTTVRFVVDEDRAYGSAAVAPAPAPRLVEVPSLDFVPL
jgi:hypothetical protein